MWDLGKEWRETSIFDGVNLADVNCYKKGSEEKEAVFDLFSGKDIVQRKWVG